MLNSVLYLRYFLLRTHISQNNCIYGKQESLYFWTGTYVWKTILTSHSVNNFMYNYFSTLSSLIVFSMFQQFQRTSEMESKQMFMNLCNVRFVNNDLFESYLSSIIITVPNICPANTILFLLR